MASVNKIILVGNLGKDPEVRTLDSGVKVASFSLATSEKMGETQKTEWHNIVLWRGLAEVAEKYIKKGSKIYLEGKIQSRDYTDKEGNKKYITEIIGSNLTMLDTKGGSSSSDSQSSPASNAENSAKNYMGKNPAANQTEKNETASAIQEGWAQDDDDLPF